MKITGTEWMLKRIAGSAAFFFGSTPKQRNLIRYRLARSAEEVATADDIRRILGIKPSVWAVFMAEASKTGNVVRDFNRLYPYHNVQGDDAVPGNQPSPEPTGFHNLDNEAEELKAKVAELEAEVDRLRQMGQPDKGCITVEFKSPVETKRIERAHKTLPALLRRVMAGLNVYLVGPAGSGKTTAAETVSETLSLDFGFMSVGIQTTKTDIFGFISANGDYVATEFRKRYENGGVFLFDELDAGHGGVLTAINAALAGTVCAFPDRMVKKHPEFRCLAAGNTYGTGPDRVYVGRNELDGASLDRFDFLEWGYDEDLERELAIALWPEHAEKAEKWFRIVAAARHAIQELGIRLVVSPRATFDGIRLLIVGEDPRMVMQTRLWKNLKPAEIKRVEEKMKLSN